ncbi:hypothetical protein C900_03985 [Fulvivirga imtechensis AK7]|uniref:Uncharacterized protein n=1 Tax=Fulvivirga imtechensis AK7 TaxID=1237149 RepID=L8JNA7_9BACT|nr:hypothetical protein C900_03985 [Fulvivirga imtechensis AK7]
MGKTGFALTILSVPCLWRLFLLFRPDWNIGMKTRVETSKSGKNGDF